MSGGEVAGLIVAVFWAILVCFLAYVLVALAKVLRETGSLVRGVTDQTVPLLGEVTTTVSSTNAQLVRVDAITSNAQTVTSNVASLSTLFAATLGSPLVKVAAFSYGVRRAFSERQRGAVTKRVRSEMKAERAARRGKGA
jgi:uncharacterized protein YoxC